MEKCASAASLGRIHASTFCHNLSLNTTAVTSLFRYHVGAFKTKDLFVVLRGIQRGKYLRETSGILALFLAVGVPSLSWNEVTIPQLIMPNRFSRVPLARFSTPPRLTTNELHTPRGGFQHPSLPTAASNNQDTS